MLEVDRLTVHYGRVVAVQAVSFTVAEGEVVGLIGPNGAGKTTCLAVITGAVTPTEGTVSFDGRSLLGMVPEEIVRNRVALVPEGRRIFGSLTVAENLQLGAIPQGRGPHVDEAIERVLERFPVLRTYHRAPAGRLSGGEQQQLAIARALLANPRLLLLDEPSLGLAPQLVDLVFDIMGELKAEGMTMLLVEQNAMRAVEFADRSYVLRSGTMARAGTREELLATADFASLYLGL